MVLADPDVPGADGLLSEPGRDAAGAFLAQRGWACDEISPVQVLYQPAHSASARFRACARHHSGVTQTLTLTLDCRRDPAPEALPPVGDDLLPEPVGVVGPYSVWVFPYDPSLPGLPEAAAGTCLPDHFRADVAHIAVEPVGYRPRRRAVLRYDLVPRSRPGAETQLFAKVLRPARARAVLEVARALRGSEIPLRLGLPFARRASGVLLSRALAGRPLRDSLLAGDPLPAPGRLARLGDTLAALSADLPETAATHSPRGVPTAERARAAATLVARLVPAQAGVLDPLVEALAGAVAADRSPVCVVHGDLHEAQVLVAGDGSLGLVDLDDLGYGDPILDAANLSAHLVALAAGAPRAASAGILAYRAALRDAFVERLGCDPAELAWREAYVMLLLAPGPFRVLRGDWPARVAMRVDLAADLLRRG